MPPVLPCLVHLPGTCVSRPAHHDGDDRFGILGLPNRRISIHAPAWGGDLDGGFVLVHGVDISTHAPHIKGAICSQTVCAESNYNFSSSFAIYSVVPISRFTFDSQ